ncbi:hypothetical protein [Ideonella livida]|uniref:hypothetical protein n=1 Tax=Ideonella livida TaxID=2707176 RepID=UPI001940220D|nr:hypothetical protein [Ideonella livida]
MQTLATALLVAFALLQLLWWMLPPAARCALARRLLRLPGAGRLGPLQRAAAGQAGGCGAGCGSCGAAARPVQDCPRPSGPAAAPTRPVHWLRRPPR